MVLLKWMIELEKGQKTETRVFIRLLIGRLMADISGRWNSLNILGIYCCLANRSGFVIVSQYLHQLIDLKLPSTQTKNAELYRQPLIINQKYPPLRF